MNLYPVSFCELMGFYCLSGLYIFLYLAGYNVPIYSDSQASS